MLILILFTFVSGLLTILAPCVWPILPVIFVTSSGSKHKPLGITLGILTTFSIFTLIISIILRSSGIGLSTLTNISVVILLLIGVSFIFPSINKVFETLISKLTNIFGIKTFNSSSTGFVSGILTGLSLGILWSPCAGPIVIAIASIISLQGVTSSLLLLFLVYLVGVGLPLFLLATFGQKFVQKSRFINKYLQVIQQVFGVLIILIAISIYTGFDKKAQTWLLKTFPAYSNFTYRLESSSKVDDSLDALKR